MFFLVSSALYSSTTHGEHGPTGHFIVDNIWTCEEFINDEHVSRIRKHSLDFNIAEVIQVGDYTACILKTTFLKRLQRCIKKFLRFK